MPLLNGIEAVRKIKKISPDVKVVFLTMHSDVSYAVEAFESGANGYVLKHSAPGELVDAINAVINDETYISPMIAGELLETYKTGAQLMNRKS